MSLVVFPFKDESDELLVTNVAAAARHDAVDEVWAVAADKRRLSSRLGGTLADVGTAARTSVDLIAQERIGVLRPGKGDAMNTALLKAAHQGRDRVHFYDADITNFDASWIEGAERAADQGYGVVRHRFPRASTDAMITWMITRPSLAMIFPGTLLPRLDQPLGGELLLTGRPLADLAGSELVTSRSDWGIDTVITYRSSLQDDGLFEHNVADGKRHSLYGSLQELFEMAVECLDAACSLQGLDAPTAGTPHAADPPAPVPADLARTVAYDFEGTSSLLDRPWGPGEAELAESLPGNIQRGLDPNRNRDLTFMDEDLWGSVLRHLHAHFRLGEPQWEALAFRLWVARVLAYTTDHAMQGYDHAISYLEATIRSYEASAESG